jgi:hypothetical protein
VAQLIQETGKSVDQPPTQITSSAALAAFIASNPGAQRVASSLKIGAEVSVRFASEPGDWRMHVVESGKALFEQATATDPDFELYLPPAAVTAITANSSGDVGEIGILFFQHIVAKEPARKVGVKVHSGIVKLTRRGWLGVLSLGGPKLVMWMAGKGLRGPGAIANALSRLKG